MVRQSALHICFSSVGSDVPCSGFCRELMEGTSDTLGTDLLELELYTPVSCHAGAGNKAWVLCQSRKSLQPRILLLLLFFCLFVCFLMFLGNCLIITPFSVDTGLDGTKVVKGAHP